MLALTIGATAVLLYGVISVWHWNQYRTAYVQSQEAIGVKLSAALVLPTVTSGERDQKLIALWDAARKIEAYPQCDIGALYGWQAKLVKTYDDWHAMCVDQQAKFAVFSSKLKDLVAFAQDAQKVDAILKPLVATRSVKEPDFQSQVMTWQKAESSLDELKLSSSFSNIKNKIQKAVKTIHANWSLVLDKHKTQDMSGYESAVEMAISSYDLLNKAGKEVAVQFKVTLSALQSAYDKLSL